MATDNENETQHVVKERYSPSDTEGRDLQAEERTNAEKEATCTAAETLSKLNAVINLELGSCLEGMGVSEHRKALQPPKPPIQHMAINVK